MREVVFDTETNGLDTYQGHRLVEVGCIEGQPISTGRTFPPLPKSRAGRTAEDSRSTVFHTISSVQTLFEKHCGDLSPLQRRRIDRGTMRRRLGFLNAELEA